MASEDGCLFCRIVAGDVPAEIVRIGSGSWRSAT